MIRVLINKYLNQEHIITGIFFTGWGTSSALNFGGKLPRIFAKGDEKP
jgi:hypothetical protein